MNKLNILAAVGGVLVVALVARISVAAPLSQAADATIRAAATMSLVEQAHGCNRVCRVGWVPRWGVVRFHRHVGSSCRPVRC